MPFGFNMFKAFSGSRNRAHRGDPTIYTEYPQGYPPAADFQPEPIDQSLQPRVLRRSSIKRREPLFTPLPSRTPTDADDYNEGYIQVDSPDAVMGGALNARPPKIASSLSSLRVGPTTESPVSETLSEREHREHVGRLHDVPRLLDRSPQLQRTGSFHSGHRERINTDDAIVMRSSPSRSSASGSDHTIEALHTPPSMRPSERVIPPLPRNYTGGYTYSRSPTDIYGGHPYEVRSHHNSEIYLDRHGPAFDHQKDGPIYYIIPGGMNVIFQDEHGNEITRVGDFSGRLRSSRPGPFVVQDEHGKELYRYDGHDRGSHRGYGEPQIVRVDAYPSSSLPSRDMDYPSHSYRSDRSYRRGYGYHSDHTGYHDGRERDGRGHRDHWYRGYADYPDHNRGRDWRDHQNHQHRGYTDYPNYGEHRDQRHYRDISTRGHREHGGYGEHGDYKHQGRSEIYAPSRVSSRASHRSYSHSGQVSQERTPQQYSNSMSDERRSERDYAASHHSAQHQDEVDISGGLQALHM